METFTELGDRNNEALLAHNLAAALRRIGGDTTEQTELLERSTAGFRETADSRGTARAMESMARVLDVRGEHAPALVLHTESLKLRRELGDVSGIIFTAEGMAYSLACAHRQSEAARLLGHVDALRVRNDRPRSTEAQAEIEPTLALMGAAFDQQELAAELAAGAAASFDDLVPPPPT